MVLRDESVGNYWNENCWNGARRTMTARAWFGEDAEATER